MQLKIKNQENFWSGLMFIGFGILAIAISRDYPLGSAMRMGPGYFPTYLGAIMALLGVIIVLGAFKTEGEKIKPFAWRGMILLTLAFSIFGWAIDHIGFVPALFAMIVCSALAGKEFKLLEVLIMSVVLILGCIALFIYGLELPFPLFWW
ncbi:MAG: tripartite tricarboxylate transporter TctB family protein, partial [Pseudomonadota bacterium]